MAQGKHDAKGRSSGKFAGWQRKAMSPPEGEPWVWHTRELLRSPAWRGLSPYARRFLEFLEIEHMNHAGLENGNLAATYDQLAAFGIPRKYVSPIIWEVTELKLVEVTCRGGRDTPSRYRLTYYSVLGSTRPTNDWKLVDEAVAEGIAAVAHKMRVGSRGRKAGHCFLGVPDAGTTVGPAAGTTPGTRSGDSLVN